jgi:hypothetical protein
MAKGKNKSRTAAANAARRKQGPTKGTDYKNGRAITKAAKAKRASSSKTSGSKGKVAALNKEIKSLQKEVKTRGPFDESRAGRKTASRLRKLVKQRDALKPVKASKPKKSTGKRINKAEKEAYWKKNLI